MLQKPLYVTLQLVLLCLRSTTCAWQLQQRCRRVQKAVAQHSRPHLICVLNCSDTNLSRASSLMINQSSKSIRDLFWFSFSWRAQAGGFLSWPLLLTSHLKPTLNQIQSSQNTCRKIPKQTSSECQQLSFVIQDFKRVYYFHLKHKKIKERIDNERNWQPSWNTWITIWWPFWNTYLVGLFHLCSIVMDCYCLFLLSCNLLYV